MNQLDPYEEQDQEIRKLLQRIAQLDKHIAELESESSFFREQCPGAFVVYQRQHALFQERQ